MASVRDARSSSIVSLAVVVGVGAVTVAVLNVVTFEVRNISCLLIS
jgi:hypothetical protein